MKAFNKKRKPKHTTKTKYIKINNYPWKTIILKSIGKNIKLKHFIWFSKKINIIKQIKD